MTLSIVHLDCASGGPFGYCSDLKCRRTRVEFPGSGAQKDDWEGAPGSTDVYQFILRHGIHSGDRWIAPQAILSVEILSARKEGV